VAPESSKPKVSPIPSSASSRSLDLVLRQLTEAIERGQLAPGEKLPAEPELASQIGVSRSVLREALKALELSGVLEVRRGYGGGTFVAKPSAEEFTVVTAPSIPLWSVNPRQLMEVRLAIEPVSARLAAARDLEGVMGLEETIAEMETFDDRPAHVLSAAVNFHVAVARASDNPVFTTVMESMRSVMYMALNRFVQNQGWRDVCRTEHEKIVKEIEAGNAERAEDAMRRHLSGEWRGPVKARG
jgi:GntR family transcriptional repressor for pyruvate dehydrogenase complex